MLYQHQHRRLSEQPPSTTKNCTNRFRHGSLCGIDLIALEQKSSKANKCAHCFVLNDSHVFNMRKCLSSNDNVDSIAALPASLDIGSRNVYPEDFVDSCVAKSGVDEVVFPSVRQLAKRFDKSDSSSSSIYENEYLETRTELDGNFYDKQFKTKINNIKNQFESKGNNNNTKPLCELHENVLKINKNFKCNDNLQLNFSKSFSGMESLSFNGVEPHLCCFSKPNNDIDHLTPKMNQKSVSDTNLNNLDIPIRARLDSGTSDLSIDVQPNYRFGRRKCLRRRRRTEPRKALPVSPLSLSPAPSSPSASTEDISLLRSNSCDRLLLSNNEWRRSNSSDSAVVVEDEMKCASRNRHLTQSQLEGLEFKSGNDETYNYATPSVVLRRPSSSENIPRTPSVIISDHSGRSVSVHVAYASSDFTLPPLLRASSPDMASSQPDCWCDTCASMPTSQSSCCVNMPFDYPTTSSVQRRVSDCSTSSYLTASEDEVDVTLQTPSPPPIRRLRKTSNWRKVRNIVQWTPFIQNFKRQKYPWVQLAGHQGNFKAGCKQGSIMKKLCPSEEKAFFGIMRQDTLKPFVPEYLGTEEGADGERYLQLRDLLSSFTSPCVMDIKMGVRTYLEEELAKARHNPKLRKDMYEKMIQIDPSAPTEAENRAKAVTKPRYMVWRETISSTGTLGFRLEGVRRADGSSSKDFKTTRSREQVATSLHSFLKGYPHAMKLYLERLKNIRKALGGSIFFEKHELIGSSLLFVHSAISASVWLIDFAKSVELPQGVSVTHMKPWVEGTHEDGYLIGLNNLIDIFQMMIDNPEQYAVELAIPTTEGEAINDLQKCAQCGREGGHGGQCEDVKIEQNILDNRESAGKSSEDKIENKNDIKQEIVTNKSSCSISLISEKTNTLDISKNKSLPPKDKV